MDYTHTRLFPAHPRLVFSLPPPPPLPLSLIHTTRKRKNGSHWKSPFLEFTIHQALFLPSFHIFLLRPPFTLPALFLSRCMHLCISCPRRHDMQPRNRGTSVYAREKVDENSRASQQPFVAGSRLFERYFRRRGVFALHPVQINGANSIWSLLFCFPGSILLSFWIIYNSVGLIVNREEARWPGVKPCSSLSEI